MYVRIQKLTFSIYTNINVRQGLVYIGKHCVLFLNKNKHIRKSTSMWITRENFGSRKNAPPENCPLENCTPGLKIAPKENCLPENCPPWNFFVNFFLSLVFIFMIIFVHKKFFFHWINFFIINLFILYVCIIFP